MNSGLMYVLHCVIGIEETHPLWPAPTTTQNPRPETIVMAAVK